MMTVFATMLAQAQRWTTVRSGDRRPSVGNEGDEVVIPIGRS